MSQVGYNGLTSKEEMLIAATVKEGWNDGRLANLTWEIEINGDDREYVADMISKGYTKGFDPDWDLTFERKTEK